MASTLRFRVTDRTGFSFVAEFDSEASAEHMIRAGAKEGYRYAPVGETRELRPVFQGGEPRGYANQSAFIRS